VHPTIICDGNKLKVGVNLQGSKTHKILVPLVRLELKKFDGP